MRAAISWPICVKGEADAEATTRLADKVAALTGIDQAVSRRLAGRFDVTEFRREFDRRDGKVTGRYDASVMGLRSLSGFKLLSFRRPSGDPLIAPLTSAAVDLTMRKLNWRPDGSYRLLNGAVERAWDFGRGLNPAESVSESAANSRARSETEAAGRARAVRSRHALFRFEDPARPTAGLRVRRERVKLVVYPGGHMFYSRDALAPGVPGRGRGADEVKEIG